MSLVVRADGIDWPILTFIDCYGFQMVDEFDLSVSMASNYEVDLVDQNGLLHLKINAAAPSVRDAIAVKPVGYERCNMCGRTSFVDSDGWCGPCTENWDMRH